MDQFHGLKILQCPVNPSAKSQIDAANLALNPPFISPIRIPRVPAAANKPDQKSLFLLIGFEGQGVGMLFNFSVMLTTDVSSRSQCQKAIPESP